MPGSTNLRGRRALALAPVIGFVVMLVVLAGPAAIPAGGQDGKGGGKTVKTTINLPALLLDNLCNGDVVNLSGDLHITTTTTPRRNGGFTVRSSADARDLSGERIAPPPPIGYHGDDREDTFSYFAPPPQPSTHRVIHWTKLVPEGDAPTMYLVIVLEETISADGTAIPTFEDAYLQCSKPKDRCPEGNYGNSRENSDRGKARCRGSKGEGDDDD